MTFGAPNKEQSWDKSQTEALHWEFWNRNTPYLGWRAELGRYFLLIDIQKRAAKCW